MIMKILICIFTLLLVFVLSLGLPTKAASQTDTIVYASPAGVPLNEGKTLEIAIRIENVTDLYAFDLEVRFAPDIFEVNEVQLGDFLDPGFMVVPNIEDGVIQFANSQIDPALPKSGDGVLITIEVQALVDIDEVHPNITKADLSDRDGYLIPCRIINSGNLFLYLPMVLR